MQTISAESVEKTYTRMWQMSQAEVMKLTWVMQREQPLLIAYLTAVDEGLLNQDERELLFYLGTVIWQIMVDSRETLPQITEKKLLDCEKANLKIAESLRHADTLQFAGAVKKILLECRQPEVFRYIVAALMDEDSEDNTVRDENLGIIILDLKTILDCFST